MNEKKLDEWDEQGDPGNFVNNHLAGSEMVIVINCENARVEISASNGEGLRRVIQLTDAILSDNKK